jgi:hypothetical protein
MKRNASLFQAVLAARRAPADVVRLASARVLVAGPGCNVAELLVRKGVGRLVIADGGRYDLADIPRRGSLASTWGRSKARVIRDRLLDVHPHASVQAVAAEVNVRNADALLEDVGYVIDVLDLARLPAKIALHRAARRSGKTVLYPCPVANGAVLWVFTPRGPSFETFFSCDARSEPDVAALRVLQRVVPHSPPMPDDVRRAILSGAWALSGDAAGVDQAAVLAAAAVENLILGRRDRVVTVPRGLLIDVSEPGFLARIIPPES